MRRFERWAERLGKLAGSLVTLPLAIPPVLALAFSALLIGAVCAVSALVLLPVAVGRWVCSIFAGMRDNRPRR